MTTGRTRAGRSGPAGDRTARPIPRATRARARDAGGPTAPLIAIDVGNTDTVVGRFRGAELEESWRLSSGRRTADELTLSLESMLKTRAAGSASVLCSVVPSLTPLWIEALNEVTGRAPLEVTAGNS